ncbi:MAG: hypothetical protein OXN86_03200 [Chloroflexota bacterium]|nr:hypothetical protein [Chloroflexota bacterium]
MASIDVLKTRDSLITQRLCPEAMAEPLAVFADELLEEATEPFARKDTLAALIEQWRVERADTTAQQAQFMADVRKEISDFRGENILRERERDERERERDERERQRVRDQEDRDARLRQWVMGAVGLGFAATTLVVGLLVAFG